MKGRYVLIAIACLVATGVPLKIGVVLDVYPLRYWGVLVRTSA
jgi:hypothetical protein